MFFDLLQLPFYNFSESIGLEHSKVSLKRQFNNNNFEKHLTT